MFLCRLIFVISIWIITVTAGLGLEHRLGMLIIDGTGSPVTPVTQNLTTIVNPPIEQLPWTSTFRFIRQPGVCQLKLDFERFLLNGADGNTSCCLEDHMRITGSVTVKSLEICGQLNNNDHMYLDYGEGSQIDIIIHAHGGQNVMTYGYKFLVTQIPCDSALRVPQKCLQYFRNESSRVTSFNFPYQQLNNQQYVICVEQKDPNAYIQWSECPPPAVQLPGPGNEWTPFSITGEHFSFPIPSPFSLGSVPPPIPTLPLIPPGSCATDYVEFFSAGKFCTAPFPKISSPVYEMFVNFDKSEPKEILGSITMENCPIPPPPQSNPEYGPWFSSTIDPNACICSPLSTVVDSKNVGFCLTYSTVPKSC